MENDTRKLVGIVVKTLRQRQGWTQATLSEKAGLNVRTIGRVERGDGLDDDTRSTLESVLGLDAGELRVEGRGIPFFPDGRAVLHPIVDAKTYADAVLGAEMTVFEPKVDEAGFEPLIEQLLKLVDDSFVWDDLPPAVRYADEGRLVGVLGELERQGWRVMVMREPGRMETVNNSFSAAKVTFGIHRGPNADALAALCSAGPQELKDPRVH